MLSGWEDLQDEGDIADDPLKHGDLQVGIGAGWGHLQDEGDSEEEEEEGSEEVFVDEDYLPGQARRPVGKKRRRLLEKHEKKTRGANTRWKGIDYEVRAKTVAYYDTLPETSTAATRRWKAPKKFHIKGWLGKAFRQKIEEQVGRPISDYAPGSGKVKNAGGRGKRAAGRGLYHFISLEGRRGAKFPLAEEQTITWCRQKRVRDGLKLTTRMLRSKMRACVRAHYGADTGFKASTGWVKRFMARHGLTWRRRNDNAKVGVEKLVVPLAHFINDLRLYRMRHPSTDRRWGKYGLCNTFNVDQVPLPFASSDPRTLEFVGTKRVWIKQLGSGLDKRQATLQLLIRPCGKQPRPTLLFRGRAKPQGNGRNQRLHPTYQRLHPTAPGAVSAHEERGCKVI
jgi:hypothetical protein